MPILSAVYDVAMPQWCFIEIKTSENFSIELVDGDFTISLKFKLSEWGANVTDLDKKCVRGIERVAAKISRDLHELPNIFEPRILYEENRTFSNTAIRVLNRLIHYFRFALYTPLLRDFTYSDGQFSQAIWLDENGNRINLNIFSAVIPTRVGKDGNLSAKRLDVKKQEELLSRLITPIQNSIVEQLLSDAQNAWFNQNYFSAIFEMAVACEQGIRGHFSQNDVPDGKSGKEIPVVHLLHRAATAVYGRSYKTEHLKEFNEIDYLFRCRNSIAHRATLLFKEDNGNLVTPDSAKIAGWWYSSFHLIKWLDSL